MGLDSAAILFLSGAKKRGVDFSTTVTLGRQSFFPTDQVTRQVFAAQGLPPPADDFVRDNPFADRFFTLLGAENLISIDYSSYEQASRTHDMNQPIPAEWHESASVVYDGGTIEHVFNAPQAFRNCMEMVRVGGHFLQVNVANNFMGHGFWQFSPELLFRIFSAENGYQVESLLLHETESKDRWFSVQDPEVVRSRVQLCNCSPTYVLTIAKRVKRVDILARPPMQSDYAPVWAGGDPSVAVGARRRTGITRLVPAHALRFVKPLLIDGSHFGLGWNQPYYRRLSAEAVVQGRF